MVGVNYWLKRLFRRWTEPSLNDYYFVSRLQTTSPGELLLEMEVPGPVISRSRDELQSAFEDNPNRGDKMPYPQIWNLETDEALFLHALVRHRKPEWVVETGVANGISSFVILSALQSNGTGHLVSFDPGMPGKPVGAFVPGSLRDRWTILSKPMNGNPLAGLTEEPLDLFIHDSDHAYTSQLREYRSAWAALRPGGLLLSDDVNASFALIKFCGETGNLKPDILVGYRKVMGSVRKPG
jgi:predicted O-methyltransferase YrrM